MSNVKTVLAVVLFGIVSGVALANPPATDPRVGSFDPLMFFVKK